MSKGFVYLLRQAPKYGINTMRTLGSQIRLCTPPISTRLIISNHQDIRSSGINVINIFNDARELSIKVKVENIKPGRRYLLNLENGIKSCSKEIYSESDDGIEESFNMELSGFPTSLCLSIRDASSGKLVYAAKRIRLLYSPREKFEPANSNLFKSNNVLLKRFEDISLSTVLFIASLPVMFLASLAIQLKSPGPVLYKGKRPGQAGKIVDFYKIRTMRPDAEKNGIGPAQGEDPRLIQPFGRLVRDYEIDEFPQLWNVLKGQWSIVGPRAENILPGMNIPDQSIPIEEFMKLYVIKPGLTGIRMIMGRDDPDIVENRITKYKYERYYIENWSWGLELKILLRTIPVILLRKGTPE